MDSVVRELASGQTNCTPTGLVWGEQAMMPHISLVPQDAFTMLQMRHVLTKQAYVMVRSDVCSRVPNDGAHVVADSLHLIASRQLQAC